MKPQPTTPQASPPLLLVQHRTIGSHQHVIVRVQPIKSNVVLLLQCTIESIRVDTQYLLCRHAISSLSSRLFLSCLRLIAPRSFTQFTAELENLNAPFLEPGGNMDQQIVDKTSDRREHSPRRRVNQVEDILRATPFRQDSVDKPSFKPRRRNLWAKASVRDGCRRGTSGAFCRWNQQGRMPRSSLAVSAARRVRTSVR